MMVRSDDAYVTILHFRAVIDGVDTSRCALDLDASSFVFLSFTTPLTPLVTTSTSGRRGRRGRPRTETREGANRFRRELSVGPVIHSVGEGAKRKRIEHLVHPNERMNARF